LEDRAAAKGDLYLRQAVDKAIVQVHQMADVLESLDSQLTGGFCCLSLHRRFWDFAKEFLERFQFSAIKLPNTSRWSEARPR
jgi:hypothetical protein